MNEDPIAQAAARVFSENVDIALLERCERGEFPADLWELASDTGLPLALASEADGGIEASWAGTFSIFREIGFRHVPLPLAETMVGNLLLSAAGLGARTEPVALIEQHLADSLEVRPNGSELRFDGRASRTAWARHCRWAVVSTAQGRIALVDLQRAACIKVEAHSSHARIPSDTVVIEGAVSEAHAANPFADLQLPVWTLGAIARSIMMVGALERALEQSVEYANDRVQFGKAIGRNQVLQQYLALMAGDVAASRMAAQIAARDAPCLSALRCPRAAFSAAVAKIRAGEAATRGTSIAHQVHGALGFSCEHLLNFGTRRLWSWREEFGSDSWWAERLGRSAVGGRATRFWPSIVDRRFDDGLRAPV